MNNIKELLSSKKTTDVRKAARLLQKDLMPELEDLVVESFKNQLNKGQRSWETICVLIKCIGLNQYKAALPLIEGIVDLNEEHDAITIEAGLALIRLKRIDLSDVSEILKRLSTTKFSLAYGMFNALGYDKMQPCASDVKTIIDFAWDFGINEEKGYGDPRYGLIAACAGWDKSLVKDFLYHILTTTDFTNIRYIAENSLIGKYVRLA